MSERLIVSCVGNVLTVVNSNPARRNSLSFDFYDEFTAALETAKTDKVSAVVLTGAGGFFCAGGDMDGLSERAAGPVELRREGVNRLNNMILTIRKTPFPVIAAVEGGAAGAGLSLMLACDLIVAARDAFVSAAYVKIGLTPDGGMTDFLAQALPRQLATEMMLTGDRVMVERLASAGIVNQLCEPGEAVTKAQELATRFAGSPSGSIANIKRLIEAASHPRISDQLESEATSICDALGGAEAHEGIAAFKQKRKPVWPK